MSFEWNDNSSDDVIDIRDVIERFEELESELESAHEEGEFQSDFDDWILNCRDNSNPIYAALGQERGRDVQSAIEEFYKIRELLSELAGNGGDEQWRGDWYPLLLIRDSHFTEHCQQELEDCGTLPKNSWWICIDWEGTARNMKQDYSAQDVDGTTYYYR